MAQLVHTGAICDRLGLQATKIPFGGVRLTNAAFSIQPASEAVEQYARYAFSGRFDSDVGAVFQQPAIIDGILRFRESQEGIQFRSEVREKLRRETGSEFQASVNAGLERNIPSSILQKAHDRLAVLMNADARLTTTPVV
jgi:hypothetical protein